MSVNEKKPVMASFRHRKPMTFESVNDACAYFRDIGHPLPNAKAIVRRIENCESWTYTDVINDGNTRTTRIVEVWFDWA
jgi:hypothetical protein